jgi:PKD repeat protein
MTITFQVTGPTDGDPSTLDCKIHIGVSGEVWNTIDISSFILNPSQEEMPLDLADGQIETYRPAPHPPEAKFTWTPTMPYAGDAVTFDGSASKAGFDGTHTCPITEWRWDFNGDLAWDVVENDPVTTWTFTDAGTYNVTLEVYAPGSLPTETDQEWHLVTVLERPMGPNIDLYADMWSIGPNQEGDAHAPQELVCLYAKVTYNDDPVANKLVAFQVIDANGTDIIYRVDDTDENGIATVCFRIPNKPAFGTWLAIATVDIAQVTKNDTMPFKVGWIIEILSIQLTDSLGNPLLNITKTQTMWFTITLQNIAKSSRTATLTVTVYDDVGQPIGSIAIVDETFTPGESTKLNFALTVPSYAFVGRGKAFANALTALPADGGVPLCPEKSTEFAIKKP